MENNLEKPGGGDEASRPTGRTGGGNEAAGNEAAGGRSNIFVEIFARIWAVWGMVAFVVTMLIFYIPFLALSYFRADPLKTINFVRCSRIWMGVYLRLIGCPLRVRGKEKFKKGQTYIVVCNHNSLIDVPASYPVIPGGNKTIAKTSFAKTPLFGLMYRTGSVLVDRKNENSRRESFISMKAVLDMGLHMCLYPEGTRNRTGDPLKSFHDGAFRLAVSTGKEIMPAVIFGTRKVMPVKKVFYLVPHRLRMDFLDPIPVLPGDTVEGLKEKTFKMMWDYYRANEGK